MVTIGRMQQRALVSVIGVALVGCSDGVLAPEDAPQGPSDAFGVWAPGPDDTCTAAIHDGYAVLGPDGKLYPTWHPAVDPDANCTFGHEHGRNPEGSDLFGEIGQIPFGYAGDVAGFVAPHVGHKVEWENNVAMSFDGVGDAIFASECDVLVQLHQGSAGAGSFTNPHHELAYHAHCDGGIELHLTLVSTIGTGGEFTRSCSDGSAAVVLSEPFVDGGGRRRIPDRTCIDRHVLVPEGENSDYRSGLRESWQMSESIRTEDGHRLASIGPYFNVFNPSRFHDPAATSGVGRPMDVCYEVTATGARARGGICAEATDSGRVLDIAWNDPRSLFDGAERDVDINRIRITNSDGPGFWYTDAYGKNGQPEPFEGSIRQIIARIDNEGVAPHGPRIGRERSYREEGVHPPN